jgi:hypothetical protein
MTPPPPTISNVFQIGVDNAMITVPQNYTVPANPPSTPCPPTLVSQPTNTQTTTTKDIVTIYVSAIKGFHGTLTMSYYVTRIDTYVDPDLPSEDATTALWQGKIGDGLTWVTGVPWVNPLEPLDNGWVGTFGWKLQPNSGNSLNTYVATNYRTLWINPLDTGGLIDPTHPPSYQVNIFAEDTTDPLHPTYAACSFTLVVLPSVADYGIGVTETILTNGKKLFGNSVTLPEGGAGFATLYFDFYPLESTALDMIPNQTRVPIGITFETSVPETDDIIDWTTSTIYSVGFGTFYLDSATPPGYVQDPPSISLASGLTRDIAITSSGFPVVVILYLKPGLSATLPNPSPNPVLFKITGTDTNGATASAYTIVTWNGS